MKNEDKLKIMKKNALNFDKKIDELVEAKEMYRTKYENVNM